MCVLIYIVQKKNKLNWLETYLIVSSTYVPTLPIIKLGNVQKPKVQVVYHPRRLAEIGHFRFVILSLGFFSRTKTWQYTQKRPKISCGKAFIVASACDQIDDQSLGAIFRHGLQLAQSLTTTTTRREIEKLKQSLDPARQLSSNFHRSFAHKLYYPQVQRLSRVGQLVLDTLALVLDQSITSNNQYWNKVISSHLFEWMK